MSRWRRRPLGARFRGLPRPFYALFGATLVNRLGGVVEPFLALYLAHRDLPVTQIGVVVALLGLVNRMRRRDALAAGGVLIAAGMGIEGLAAKVVAYALPVAVWTTGEILVTSVGPATIADLAPAHLRGRYQAVFGTAFSGAYVIAPVAGAALLDAAGGRALWSACAALGLVATAAQLALAPVIARRTGRP